MTNQQAAFSQDFKSLLALAPARTRRLLALTGVLGFTSGLLEAVSVAAVAPLFVALTGIDLLQTVPQVARVLPEAWLAERTKLVFAACVFFALLFVLKSIISLVVAHTQARVGRMLSADLASRLFRQYLTQPYRFYLERHTADVQTRLTNGVQAASAFLASITQLAVEATVLVAVAALLLYVDARVAIGSTLVIGVPAFLVYRMARRRVLGAGAELLELHRQAAETTLHALGGIKELRLLGREQFFGDRFDRSMHATVGREAQFGAMQALPRVVVELAAVFGILALAGALAVQGRVATIGPVLAIYAAAAFRLLPAVNRILASLQMMRWSEAGFHAVAEDLRDTPPAPMPANATPLVLRESLRIDDLHFSYGPDAREVLSGLSLKVDAGEWVAIIGDTGTGKSTLIDVMLGLLAPGAGRVLADGQDVHLHPRAWQAGVGYVPQSIFLVDDTVRANIAFGVPAAEVDEQRLRQVVEEAQLTAFVSGLPGGLDARVGERGVRISGGERQRIGIARALYRGPGVLLLDEATSALDAGTEAALLTALRRRQGLTVVAVTHRMAAAERSDRAYRLIEGSLQPVSVARMAARAGGTAGT